MSVPNPVVALRTMLLADAGVSAIVGTDVFGVELPKDITPNMPKAALVIKPGAGGMPGMGCARLGGSNIEFWSYGADPLEAYTLALAAYEALKFFNRVVFDNTLLHNAVPLTTGISFRDDETDWPVQMQPFLVMVGETAVTP